MTGQAQVTYLNEVILVACYKQVISEKSLMEALEQATQTSERGGSEVEGSESI